ncbi:hypothetical protein C8A00DRAFT_30522 [Chaetomidium leptoderma]|uniref:Uncharacterized protein n=1 Tax=Chaetomidium leptoderma TaxID=669021 RepID=A0AAN6VUP2_9PEZI|nr:hypothetical protein C8A00DRAFT_30522 [Chaetomidium leptoderma]
MPNMTFQDPSGLVLSAAFLFRSAWPAISGTRTLTPLRNRQSDRTTCGTEETTCPQGGWCCGAGEACSLQDGAFFCCPAGAGAAGCARVCAVGDFQIKLNQFSDNDFVIVLSRSNLDSLDREHHPNDTDTTHTNLISHVYHDNSGRQCSLANSHQRTLGRGTKRWIQQHHNRPQS